MDIFKYIELFREKPLKGLLLVLMVFSLSVTTWFGIGFFGEKGKQLATDSDEVRKNRKTLQGKSSNAGSGGDTAQKRLAIYDSVKRATVAIALYHDGDLKKPYTILGSGFCIHHRGIIVTCHHVIDAFLNKPFHKQLPKPSDQQGARIIPLKNLKARIPYAIFFDTKSSKTEISVALASLEYIIAKADYDLGVARVQPHAAYPDGYPYLETETYENVHEGMEIATCGFPLGNYLQDKIGTITSSFTKGILSSVIPSNNVSIDLLKGFQLDLTATFGSSGGPVFSENTGKVFGVLQSGLKGVQGITIAQPIWPIADSRLLNQALHGPLDRPTN